MKIQGLWGLLIIGVVAILHFTGFASAAAQVRTECIGNGGNCGPAREFGDPSVEAIEWLGVSWDADKIRGISFKLFNNLNRISVGDVYPGPYVNAEVTFAPGEFLTSLTFKDSGYGYNSLRRFELSTNLHALQLFGPDGFDTAVTASGVYGTRLCGFYGLVNPDNFMQSLGAVILLPDAAPATGLALKTEFIGNNFQRWAGGFDDQQGNYPVQWLAVRWDGDKVRGLTFRLFNGLRYTEGDFSAQYESSEIYFSPGETLASLTLRDSGYGHGSLRKIEMTTSEGKSFNAGPDGFDSVTTPPVAGATLLGFYGLVNIDNFMQSLGANVVYPVCGDSGIQIIPDDDADSTPVTDLIGLAGPEQFCSTTPSTCTAPPLGNRRLLSGTVRRSLIDTVTQLVSTSREYGYFTHTVALYDLNISDRASTPTITLFTNTDSDVPETLSWRIDRQQTRPETSNRNGIRYNLLAVQGGPFGQRGQTFASVLVPDRYHIGMRRIRRAFLESQTNGATVVLNPIDGYALDWSAFPLENRRAPPQNPPPPGISDLRVNGYIQRLPFVAFGVSGNLC